MPGIGLLVCLAMAATPPTRAPLRLQVHECPDIDEATVNRVVTMELQAALADEQRDAAITTATARCADGRAQLTIDDPVTGKITTRTLDLAGQPRGLRSRLLGLAVSEAVLASWIELQLSPEAATPGPEAAAPADARREAAAIAERRLQGLASAPAPTPWTVIAGPTVRWFSSGVATFGLSAGGRHWLDKHPGAGVGLELDASYGEHSVREARATATGVSFAPCLYMRSTFGPVTATAGVGWRLGLALLSAEPNVFRAGGSAWSIWTGPLLAAEVGMPLSDSLFVRANMELGLVAVPSQGRVGTVPVIELGGSWLAGLLSLATKL